MGFKFKNCLSSMVCAAILALGVGGAALAQETEQGIIVVGEGRIATPPDMATITLGVTETASTAKAAMDAVTQAVAGILLALDAEGVAPEDRQTSGFYLHPMHREMAVDDTGPAITGYRAGNRVTVRVRDLTRLGAMLDVVIDIGANDFNGLNFGLQDEATPMAAARALAVADARARAEQLAEAAGLKLGNVLRLTEQSRMGGPVMMEAASRGLAMDEALASGEVDTVARVTMVFDIAPDLP